jgi:hypothetical protein
MAKVIWMAHLDEEQASLWHTALTSQEVQVILKSPAEDLKEELQVAYDNGVSLPNLVLLDVGIKVPKSEMLQSGSVCQWALQREGAPKVVLVNPRQEKIKDIERAWALRRGASEMLPRLSTDNLVDLVSIVTELLGLPCVVDLLHSAVRQKMAVESPTATFLEDQPASQVATAIKNPEPDVVKERAKYVIYRGVRVRR